MASNRPICGNGESDLRLKDAKKMPRPEKIFCKLQKNIPHTIVVNAKNFADLCFTIGNPVIRTIALSLYNVR